MKNKIIIFVIINIIALSVFGITIYHCTQNQEQMTLNVYLGESHAGKNNIAQLYYAENTKKFKSPNVITQTFSDNVISIAIGEIEFSDNYLRFDPFNIKEDFSITKLELSCGENVLCSLQGAELKSYIDKTKKLNVEVQSDVLVCTSKNDNPRMIFKKSFSDLLQKQHMIHNVLPYIVILLIYCLLGVIEIYSLAGGSMSKASVIIGNVLASIFLALGIVVVYVFQYFEGHFGQVPFGQLIYHLRTPLDGTDISSYIDVIIFGFFLIIGCIVLYFIIGYFVKKKDASRGYLLWTSFLGVFLVMFGGIQAVLHFDMIEYYEYTHTSTTLYENHYVDGRDVKLTFPETKRNLIYIFLESMEITFADAQSGGAMQVNYISELTQLAQENNCFAEGNVLNGPYQVLGATYTMGALAAQTCGVPINTDLVGSDALNSTFESENNYLPGVWSIGDVLAEQGYNQELLIGSVGNFAGRSSYFKGHGGYIIEDYNAAIEKERIPSDYKVWWGYEDKKLFDFAKEDIISLAEKEEPFNFTMLTADTHFTDGYLCEECSNEYDAQYSNVITCSSKQIMEFINWIKEQDFYENTTIVLAGDHLTMDSAYIANQGAFAFDRRMYFAIINPADGKEDENGMRSYTCLDLYPTTLSSLGVAIEGERLGLGVDLYSSTPTLVEQYGLEYLNVELQKNSKYYKEKLLYK